MVELFGMDSLDKYVSFDLEDDCEDFEYLEIVTTPGGEILFWSEVVTSSFFVFLRAIVVDKERGYCFEVELDEGERAFPVGISGEISIS